MQLKLINRCFERSAYCVVEKDGPFPDIRQGAAPSAFGDGMYIFSVSQLSSEFTFFVQSKNDMGGFGMPYGNCVANV